MIAPTRIFLCAVGLAVVACAPQGEPSQADIEADIAAVTLVRDQEVASVQSGQGDFSYLAADIVWMPPNEPALSGSTAVSEWLREVMSLFEVSLSYPTSEITVSGDLAIERFEGTVTFTPVDGGDPLEESIKGIHVYRRGDDGSWKMLYDVWNSNTPLPEMDMQE
jgi:ketosteroid isomerase-like protein